MALLHVKSTGTKESGASTADDWTDANCYPTLLAALAIAGDGNEIILDDEVHVEAAVAPGSSWTDSVTIHSRSNDATLCTLSTASATNPILGIYPSAGTPTIEVNDITMTCSATRTGLTAPANFIGVSSNTIVELSFNRCVIGPLTIETAANSTFGQVFHHLGVKERNVNFTDCVFTDITATYNDYGVLFNLSGTSPTFNFIGCTFKDWLLTYSNGTQSAGDFLGNGNIAAHNFIDCTFQDITRNNPQRCMIRPQGTTPSTIMRNCDFYRILSDHDTGEFIGTPLIDILGPFTVEGIYCEDIVVTVPETNGGGDGVTLYQDAAAVGTFRDIEVRRCIGRSGAAIFCSNGGSLDAENVRAYDCKVAHGVVYTGYNGDATVTGLLVDGCQYLSLTGSNRHAGGLGFYFRNNPAAPERDSAVVLNNATFINNDNSNFSMITIENEHATATVTATLNNVITRSDSETGPEIDLVKTGGTGELNVTTNSCNVLGGTDSITQNDGTQTTLTNNDLTSDDPLLNSDGSLSSSSPLIGIGKKWWTGAEPVGADGEPFSDMNTDIGAIQSTLGPLHPVNL